MTVRAVLRDLFSPYHPGTSAIHRLPAAVKLGAILALILVLAFLPAAAWAAYAAAAALLLLAALLSRVPLSRLAQRLLLIEPFALGMALLALFQPHGLQQFLAIMTKSTLCLSALVLLSATTRTTDLLRLLSRLRVPPLFITTLTLMHRYLFVLLDEAQRMQRARRSRSFHQGRWATWHAWASVAAHLFVRSSDRAERIYAAMCARGWKT
ncbi:MAG: cobalt ECF transporter T component CbiQ [Candidatus Hydrogenedentes bacterium]|nr:cobalt ECF transporter T component CbiQ [Candidatus Hydrogenedentota bacterium]